MGCGISKFEPKEVVEATADCPHNPPRSHKSSTTNCFTSEPKPSVQEGSSTEKQSRKGNGSSRDREVAGEKMVKMSVNVKREKVEEDDRQMETRTQINFEDPNDDQNYRKIFRGGSPSFREYCIGSKSRSRSIGSEDNYEGDHGIWPNERTLHLEKEKKEEKKEPRGKGTRKTLRRGKSGEGRSLLSTSRGRHQHQNDKFSSLDDDTSNKHLRARAS
ncbi:uncharacterized protein LOC111442180 isoform X1 [Cucurbita moschata]|uniref:Uncharacterized protein LOC111442180 isoform X1 n=1 Tax=Cucurbita moschata TaxID=3662 RepID=A0A6J1FA30_CUCMO|nr:uncharacterized protein LOC111442180 isoform X1 [Cucurbita moschata]